MDNVITAEKFKQATGQEPTQDDLEKCNCPEAGEVLHSSCGWNKQKDMPVFMVGKES